jgi:RNA recognition motif-containing protein
MTMTRLFVGNLSSEVTQDDLRGVFAAYGPVSSANVVTDPSDGRSRGFGFVDMAWQSHAVAAMRKLDGTDLKGRTINVSPARSRSEAGARGNPPRGWAVVGDGRNRW